MYPGLVGRPDFNVQFNVQFEGSYPHGPAKDGGCKKFTSKDYDEMGFANPQSENQLEEYKTGNIHLNE